MSNGSWSSFNAMESMVGGLSTGNCNGASVAGITDLSNSCFGPPFFAQKLNAFRGVPVCICTENGRCEIGQIMEVCGDYISFNNNGSLEVIPIFQITRVSLASMFRGIQG